MLYAWDPGWTAEVDGSYAPVFRGNGFNIAVPVETGKHFVTLRYHTPGRKSGWALSIVDVAFLSALILSARRKAIAQSLLP